MKHHLIKYLSQFITVNKDEINMIEKHGEIRDYKKGEWLLKEGQYARETYLILHGCIKSYFLRDGEKYITDFFIENELIIPMGYASKSKSSRNYFCVEDCVVSVGSQEKTNQLLKLIPTLNQSCLHFNTKLLEKKQIDIDDLRFFAPEIRYQKLIENKPELANRVPQFMIASYLGIQPQSLSRIRKRIAKSS